MISAHFSKMRLAAISVALMAPFGSANANDGLQAVAFLLKGNSFKPTLSDSNTLISRQTFQTGAGRSDKHTISETLISQIEPCIFESRQSTYYLNTQGSLEIGGFSFSRLDFKFFESYKFYNKTPVLWGKKAFSCLASSDNKNIWECDELGAELIDMNNGQHLNSAAVSKSLSVLAKRGCFPESLSEFKK